MKASPTNVNSYCGADSYLNQVHSSNPTEYIDDTSVRPSYGKEDYFKFRPNEKIPKNIKELIASSRSSYTYVDVVRTVIDLMIDFICYIVIVILFKLLPRTQHIPLVLFIFL